MSNNLHKITRPKGRITVDIEGENVTVEEVTVKHFDTFITIVESIAPRLANSDMESLLRTNAGDLITLISICSGKSVAFCESLSVGQTDEILSAVIQVNSDFFLQATMKVSTAAE